MLSRALLPLCSVIAPLHSVHEGFAWALEVKTLPVNSVKETTLFGPQRRSDLVEATSRVCS